MRGWIKYLLDGNQINGEDKKVYSNKVSWSKTPTYLAAALIAHDRYFIEVTGPTEYHQSDDFITLFGESKSKMVGRRLQAKIKPYYSHAVIQAASNGIYITFGSTKAFPLGNIPKIIRQEVIDLKPHIGEWLTTELEVKSGQIKVYFDKSRI